MGRSRRTINNDRQEYLPLAFAFTLDMVEISACRNHCRREHDCDVVVPVLSTLQDKSEHYRRNSRMRQVMEISRSDLAGARDTGNREFLESTFAKAAEVITAGGSVHLMQVFSDVSKEVTDIIDNLEQLDHVKSIYIR